MLCYPSHRVPSYLPLVIMILPSGYPMQSISPISLTMVSFTSYCSRIQLTNASDTLSNAPEMTKKTLIAVSLSFKVSWAIVD